MDITQKMSAVKRHTQPAVAMPETPLPPALPNIVSPKQTTGTGSRPIKKRDIEQAQIFQERCRQLCISVFFRESTPVRSLGFTSSIEGEGKSFLSVVMAKVLASDSIHPVTLVELNWDHPSLHETLGCPFSPGLAEWLRGECSETDIRHQIGHNLIFIPAGDGKRDAVKLLQQLRQKGLLNMLASAKDLLIADLPSIVTTAYGSLAASLVESLIVVVRTGVTPKALLLEAYTQISDLPVQGVILNQLESRIPRWI